MSARITGTSAYLGMAIGRPTKPLNSTLEETEKLEMLSHRPKSAQAIAMRAQFGHFVGFEPTHPKAFPPFANRSSGDL